MEKQVKARGVYFEDWSEEGVKLLNELTPDSEDFEKLPMEHIEKFEERLVSDGQEGLMKVFPTQEMWERIKERRFADGDEEALSYYSASFTSSEDMEDEVSVTFKIPKSIYFELKKMTYFSGYDTMKSLIVEILFSKSIELSEFLINNKFNVDSGMWELSSSSFRYHYDRQR